MQKTRPRRTGKQSASEGSAERPPVGKGRPTHVRNRLIVAVAVVAAAIAGAGAPSVLAASGRLKDSQDLVTLAERTQDALVLAHALADERDDVTSYVAAGRPRAKAPDEQRSARVDRQIEELRADTDLPAALRQDLDGIAAVRRAALTGKDGPLEAHRAYTVTITELHRLAEQLAERTPSRAGSGAHTLAELDTAVQQAAAARGLLVAALNVPTTTETEIDPITGLPEEVTGSSDADTKARGALTAAAQQARLRSDAALADFHENGPRTAVSSYDATVTGPEVGTADRYLAGLTDQPTLDEDELGTSAKKVDAALSARVDLMRGAEAALYDHRVKELEQLRDDDVTALEIRIAVLGALMLLAVGIATGMARSLTRPLAVLRLGSARLAQAEDPAAEEPVKFTGRNDEFAQVVRSVNALHAHAAALAERVATLEADRKHLVGQRQKMADAREELRAELAESAAQLQRLRGSIGSTFVNLALRTLGLVERQLAVIESLEEREQDPDRLATLFKLDHFATVMRRHSENLLVLAGTEHVQQHANPVPLVDVVRAAVSEIERYERVRIAALPPHAHVAGFAADDLSHLLAELMENATAFSPPDVPVEVSGWLLESGEVMLSVQDEGIGMTDDRLTRLNARLADFDPNTPYDQEGEDGLGLGLYVVARLAHRYGVRVQLREQKQGGVAAVVVLPATLLADAAPAAVPPASPASAATHTFSLPGADAEANSNELPGRPKNTDPVVALAERAVRAAEAEDRPGGTTPHPAEAATEAEAEAATQAEAEAATQADAEPESQAATPGPGQAAPAMGEQAREPGQAAPVMGEQAPERGSAAAAIGEYAPERGQTAPAIGEHAPQPGQATPAMEQPAPDERAEAPRQETAPASADEAARDHTRVAEAPRPDARPLETPAETTMELLLPQQPTGPAPTPPAEPAGHAPTTPEPTAPTEPRAEPTAPYAPPVSADRDAPSGAPAESDTDDEHQRTPDDGEDQLTAKGLPKRTPRITAPTARAPRQRTGSVDADALRRRLGGFRQGAAAGYRDAEAEIAEQTAQNQAPYAGQTHAEEDTGGTVEEASS
ncbi:MULTISPECIES: sensor histidine kinase [Streptomyces]|uniref:histidine kinase n=2 Tax=Streptomyces TaxID=1883 RepID=A0A2U9P6Q4_STRAS|nr:nitrate- and nitrite sensing domain-containing protein [Streptomyces actuosus]AWT45469.1 histidine kinase [Streptomyces actuosus]MBM4822087.1 nitrate- and nitrite sensing domain-containing protein [Streptomyces actuosus]